MKESAAQPPRPCRHPPTRHAPARDRTTRRAQQCSRPRSTRCLLRQPPRTHQIRSGARGHCEQWAAPPPGGHRRNRDHRCLHSSTRTVPTAGARHPRPQPHSTPACRAGRLGAEGQSHRRATPPHTQSVIRCALVTLEPSRGSGAPHPDHARPAWSLRFACLIAASARSALCSGVAVARRHTAATAGRHRPVEQPFGPATRVAHPAIAVHPHRLAGHPYGARPSLRLPRHARHSYRLPAAAPTRLRGVVARSRLEADLPRHRHARTRSSAGTRGPALSIRTAQRPAR